MFGKQPTPQKTSNPNGAGNGIGIAIILAVAYYMSQHPDAIKDWGKKAVDSTPASITEVTNSVSKSLDKIPNIGGKPATNKWVSSKEATTAGQVYSADDNSTEATVQAPQPGSLFRTASIDPKTAGQSYDNSDLDQVYSDLKPSKSNQTYKHYSSDSSSATEAPATTGGAQ